MAKADLAGPGIGDHTEPEKILRAGLALDNVESKAERV